ISGQSLAAFPAPERLLTITFQADENVMIQVFGSANLMVFFHNFASYGKDHCHCQPERRGR
ncbi:MAG: hypothetical protein IIU34_01830, partial [Bacteroidales bacterium]|nr:hypothetical protein [Bacteroidales bacterium]